MAYGAAPLLEFFFFQGDIYHCASLHFPQGGTPSAFTVLSLRPPLTPHRPEKELGKAAVLHSASGSDLPLKKKRTAVTPLSSRAFSVVR